MTAGVQMPATYADTILSYLGETRDFTMAVLTEANLPEPIAAPMRPLFRPITTPTQINSCVPPPATSPMRG